MGSWKVWVVAAGGRVEAARVGGGSIAADVVCAQRTAEGSKTAMAAKMRLPGRKGHSPGELAAGTEQKRIPPLRYGMTTKSAAE